ncbi:hypothetical protein D1872_288150 [compost metagenome]
MVIVIHELQTVIMLELIRNGPCFCNESSIALCRAPESLRHSPKTYVRAVPQLMLLRNRFQVVLQPIPRNMGSAYGQTHFISQLLNRVRGYGTNTRYLHRTVAYLGHLGERLPESLLCLRVITQRI